MGCHAHHNAAAKIHDGACDGNLEKLRTAVTIVSTTFNMDMTVSGFQLKCVCCMNHRCDEHVRKLRTAVTIVLTTFNMAHMTTRTWNIAGSLGSRSYTLTRRKGNSFSP